MSNVNKIINSNAKLIGKHTIKANKLYSSSFNESLTSSQRAKLRRKAKGEYAVVDALKIAQANLPNITQTLNYKSFNNETRNIQFLNGNSVKVIKRTKPKKK